MRKHPHLGGAGSRGKPRHGSRDLAGARKHVSHQPVEFLARQAGTLYHAVALARLGHVPDRAVHVVVEGEQVDATFGEPLAHLLLGIEIVGLVAQVKAGVGRELRALPFDRRHQAASIVGAAQARLPRTGRGVKHRGDAVADRLAVTVGERHIDREVDTGTRHHLPLEGIAMQIDDAGQHQQVARVDRKPRPAARSVELRNVRSGYEK
ncbi:hypothetical protein ACVWWG_003633 [Bradyrhizobium sp. LB7.2]